MSFVFLLFCIYSKFGLTLSPSHTAATAAAMRQQKFNWKPIYIFFVLRLFYLFVYLFVCICFNFNFNFNSDVCSVRFLASNFSFSSPPRVWDQVLESDRQINRSKSMALKQAPERFDESPSASEPKKVRFSFEKCQKINYSGKIHFFPKTY